MEGLISLIFFAALIPLLLTIGQLFTPMAVRRRVLLLLNLLVWCYEVFFFAVVCGALPHAQVHFGGGLGDLLFVFMLAAMIVVHIIVLSIMSYKTSRAALFFIPLGIVLFPLAGMHQAAARGNESNDYMTGGNCTGLYYDSAQKQEERLRREELKQASEPKTPEFATAFEARLYDAEEGDREAQNSTGCSYATGNGVEKNDTLAVKWFRKAAEGGYMLGEYNLGQCYYIGMGELTVDYAEAVKWFGKAADKEHDDAQYMLGRCYQLGRGVEKNETEAYEWLRRAARQGHRKAQEQLRANGQN